MRYAAILILLMLSSVCVAQVPEPQVTVDLPSQEVVVGQPAIIRIKVLVPTFMPSPPVFPSLEQENLLVRLPERASGPVSEAVGGETWSGVQRSYRIYPLVPGEIDFGPQNITVTYADPTTGDPIQTSVPLEPIGMNAVIPDAARDLSPLIIATGFELTQDVEGSTDLQAGGAVTRRLTAKISGTSPLLIPQLIPENQDTLVRSYPKEPRFSETEDRGVLSGERVDEVVYLAQGGGQTQLPAITVQWFNLENNTVEIAEVAAIDLELAAPNAGLPPPEAILRFAIWTVATGIAIWGIYRLAAPRFRTWQNARRAAYLASSKFALVKLRQALRDQDLSASYSALETWKERCSNPQGFKQLETELNEISFSRYSTVSKPKKANWAASISALGALKDAPEKYAQSLPPLNP